MIHVLLLSTMLAAGSVPPPPAHHHHRTFHAPTEANEKFAPLRAKEEVQRRQHHQKGRK